jgi:hypothetical protein
MLSEIPGAGEFDHEKAAAYKRLDARLQAAHAHVEGSQRTRGDHLTAHELMHATLRAMDVQDVSCAVKECYQQALIPPDVIKQIRDEPSKAHAFLERRGGMLHDFVTSPIEVTTRNVRPSVQDQITKDLASTRFLLEEMLRTGISDVHLHRLSQSRSLRSKSKSDYLLSDRGNRKFLPLYEGVMLTSGEGESEKLHAWATWWRSQIVNPSKRNEKNDASVSVVQKLLHQKIMRDQGTGRVEHPENILLFDTINSQTPGAALALFTKLFPLWQAIGYTRMMLYRHKWLRAVAGRSSHRTTEAIENERSASFFRALGMHDIGTQLADELAVREVPLNDQQSERMLIRSTYGWMLGNLQEAVERSNTLMNQRLGEVTL